METLFISSPAHIRAKLSRQLLARDTRNLVQMQIWVPRGDWCVFFYYLSVCVCWLGAAECVKIYPSRARKSGDTLISGDQGETLVLLVYVSASVGWTHRLRVVWQLLCLKPAANLRIKWQLSHVSTITGPQSYCPPKKQTNNNHRDADDRIVVMTIERTIRREKIRKEKATVEMKTMHESMSGGMQFKRRFTG